MSANFLDEPPEVHTLQPGGIESYFARGHITARIEPGKPGQAIPLDRRPLLDGELPYDYLDQALADTNDMDYVKLWCGGKKGGPLVLGAIATDENGPSDYLILRHPNPRSKWPVMLVSLEPQPVQVGDEKRRVFIFPVPPKDGSEQRAFTIDTQQVTRAGTPSLRIQLGWSADGGRLWVGVSVPSVTLPIAGLECNRPIRIAHMPRRGKEPMAASSFPKARAA